ncbi:uncharacterized protein LOC143817913 [Ranitomeya variabilis]|uniref:uncharacterized protein LOC143817913 n=1 Tax=Ranitomeya variabilis TaxID=490064 RepID=UPI004056DA58
MSPPYIVCSTNASSHDASIDTLLNRISKVRRAAVVIQEFFIQMLQFLDEYCDELRCEEEEWRKMREMLQSLMEFSSPCEGKADRRSQRIIATYFTEMRSLLRNKNDGVCPLLMVDVMMTRLLHLMTQLSARM